MASELYDLVVIGAGISGIAAAKFYLDTHPNCRLAVLEKEGCVGGVWNARRLYEPFWTQSELGAAEYGDLPLKTPPEEDIFMGCFKAKYMNEYLESYVDHFTFAGTTIRSRIRFNFAVQNIEKVDGKWVISGPEVIHAAKVMVASGITSSANMPNLPFRERFEGQVIHQEDFGQYQDAIFSDPGIKHVTVLGGAKSSADMIYSAVKAGKEVSWIIRTQGSGPGFFLSAKNAGPYKNALELGSTRLAGTLSPSFTNPRSLWSMFLHETWLGRKLIDILWTAVDNQTRVDAGFANRDPKSGFEHLAPDITLFWQDASGGLINRTDFWETLAEGTKVYRDDIVELDKGLVRLKSDIEIPTDVILCGTGFVPSLGFFSQPLRAELGLPHLLENSSAKEAELWTQLEKEADKEVLARFPQLGNPPPYYKKPVLNTPYRLYKTIAPLHDNTIAFIGHVLITDYFRTAQAQAIWATAYLDNRLELPSLEERQKEVALLNAWSKRRYLNNGNTGIWMVFEFTGYTDGLLGQVGLSSHRRGWLSDFFGPNKARDMRGIKDEYIKKFGCDSVLAKDVGGDSNGTSQT